MRSYLCDHLRIGRNHRDQREVVWNGRRRFIAVTLTTYKPVLGRHPRRPA